MVIEHTSDGEWFPVLNQKGEKAMCANVVIIREDFMQTYPCIYRESRTFTGDFEGIAKFFGLLGEDGKWHGLKGNKPDRDRKSVV